MPLAALKKPSVGAFAAGLLAAAGQAPLSLWPATLAGLAVLYALVLNAPRAGLSARYAWVGGGGYFVGALFWIVEPFMVDIARHGWMAPFALALMAFGLALFWGGAAYAAMRTAPPRRQALMLAVCLALAELARSYVFTGFPWALIGHIWIGTPVMQLAAFGGGVALTFLTTLALGLAFTAPRWWVGAAMAALLIAGAWGFGSVQQAKPVPPRAEAITVRLLQPNAAQHIKWRPDMVPVFFDRQLGFSAAESETQPDLIVWPETAVAYMLDRSPEVREVIADYSGGATVAFGVQRRSNTGVHNSLAVIDSAGTLTHVYDKAHLVPFGEYMPLSWIFAHLDIGALAALDSSGYTPGEGVEALDLGALGRVIALICYEAVFPQDIRGAVPGADWILHITNDAWFGRINGPYQHLAQTQLRAVETGLPVLRSANTGVSAAIDARGRVVDRLALNTDGYLDVQVPGATLPPLYVRTGDWGIFGLLLLLGGLLITLRGSKPD